MKVSLRFSPVVALDVMGAAPGNPCLVLPLASLSDWVAALHHNPPTEPELERLIANVEDALMPQLRRVSVLEPVPDECDPRALNVNDEVLSAWTAPTHRLQLAEVEAAFNRLAHVVARGPAQHAGLSLDASFSVRLVVLREVMHHGSFSAADFFASAQSAG